MPSQIPFRPAVLAALLAAAPALAEPPRVAVDVAPVHALAARAMAGLGEPSLILPPGASPHGYAMRPSQARALSEADLAIWTGAALTPWLADALATLAPEARRLELLAVPGTPLLTVREGAGFEAHDHDAHGHGHDHDAHGHDRDHGDDEPAAIDPHAWLDPHAAKVWLDAIAATLAELDPDNAAAYAANAAEGRAELDALAARIDERVAPVRDRPFVVFHDAYQYFERRFGIPAAAAVSFGDARRPGAARVAEVRALIEASGAVCVFSEPQFEPRLVATLVDGLPVRRAVLDPLGSDLPPGPELLSALLERLAGSLTDCLSGE